jgi:hypothetical protein
VSCCYEPNPWSQEDSEGGATTLCLLSVSSAPEGGCEERLQMLSCAADLAANSCEQFNIWRTFVTHGHINMIHYFSSSCDVPEDLPCHDETVAVAAACADGYY